MKYYDKPNYESSKKGPGYFDNISRKIDNVETLKKDADDKVYKCLVCGLPTIGSVSLLAYSLARDLDWPTEHVRKGHVCHKCLPLVNKIVGAIYYRRSEPQA